MDYCIFLMIAGLALNNVGANPQRSIRQTLQNQDIQRQIDEVFFSTPRPRPGIGTIVTSDPIFVDTGATMPTQVSFDNTQSCTCVSYHLCDPNTNTTIPNTTAMDDAVRKKGFGLYEPRIGIVPRSDAESCENPLELCCKGEAQRNESFNPVIDTLTPTPNVDGCGIRNFGGLDFELTGAFDNEAGFGEFPWTIAIILIASEMYVCSGSLIHPKVVLTAYHNVKNYADKPNELKLRAGEWDTKNIGERLPHQERIALRIFVHPNYDEISLANDVAIVELASPYELNIHISTICLPPSYFVPNQQDCFASGWGKTVFGENEAFSVLMKKVPLPIVEFNRCQSELRGTRLGAEFELDRSFICAGGQGRDTCQGDGGAPLVCPIGRPEDNRYAQNGIVVYGIGCNNSHPAVYANVAMARTWIDAQMRSIGLDTSYYTYMG